MNKLDILLIGIASKHNEHIVALKNNIDIINIVGVCNVDLREAKNVAMIFNSKYFTDLNEAIKKSHPVAALVSVPHNIYGNIIPVLIENKIHILKEKPFAINLEESITFLKLLKSYENKFMLISQRRFHPSYVKARKYIKLLGKVSLIKAYYTFYKPPMKWRKFKEFSGGGIVIDAGYHIIDLLNFYFGLPYEVICKLNRDMQTLDYDTEDNATIILSYKDDKIANILLSRVSVKKNDSIEIYGEKGNILITRSSLQILLTKEEKKYNFNFKDNWEIAFNKQLEYFTNNVLTNKDNVPNYLIGYENTVIIDACYKSHSLNKSIAINTLLN